MHKNKRSRDDINWRMGKENVIYPYNGMLFGNKMKLNSDTCYNMDWKHLLIKRPVTKDYIVLFILCEMSKIVQFIGTEVQFSVCLELGDDG